MLCSRSKTEQSLLDEVSLESSANAELASLMDQQRRYNFLVKELREEMKKNEKLHNSLAALQREVSWSVPCLPSRSNHFVQLNVNINIKTGPSYKKTLAHFDKGRTGSNSAKLLNLMFIFN